jgi:hypothetical protein
MVDADSPLNETLFQALRDRLEWLLSDSDSWNTSGIGTGTGLAATGRVGLLSGTDWDTFNGKQAAITGGSAFYCGQTSCSEDTLTSTGVNRAYGVACLHYNGTDEYSANVYYDSSLFKVRYGRDGGTLGTASMNWFAWS